MKVKSIVDEDFVNYKKPSMFIGTTQCDWKCCIDAGVSNSMCQNSPLAKQKNIEISADEIFRRYSTNPITSAIVFGGLEPMLQFDEMFDVIKWIRHNGCNDDIVIYTGYYPTEICPLITRLRMFDNIVIKFGRYIPRSKAIYDEVLGVTLNSDNQFALAIERALNE